MDVIRDRQVAVLTEQNLQFLTEQARAARSRFEVGEGTRTDVAQADASRSSAVAQLSRRPRAGAGQCCDLSPDRRRRAGQAQGRFAAGEAFAVEPRCGDHDCVRRAPGHPLHPASGRCGGVFGEVGTKARCCRSFRLLPAFPAPIATPFRASIPEHAGDGTTNSASIGATLTIPIYSGGRTSAMVRQNEGIAQPGPHRSRCQPRPGAAGRDLGMDAIYRRAAKRRRQQAGDRRRATCAQRRHRGAQCRPAHHARRAECAGRRHHRQDQPCQHPNAIWWWRAMPSCRLSVVFRSIVSPFT